MNIAIDSIKAKENTLETIIGLHTWLHHVFRAVQIHLSGAAPDEVRSELNIAQFALDKILLGRTKAAQGKWTGWYDNDRLFDLRQLRQATTQAIASSGCNALF